MELIGGFYEIDFMNAYSNIYAHDQFKFNFDISSSYSNVMLTNNGRTSTILALQQLNCIDRSKEILLPDYLCESILEAIVNSGLPFDFYHINSDLSINIASLQSKLKGNASLIYYINYFGIPQGKEAICSLKKLAKENNCLLLEDITQSLFSNASYDIGFGDIIIGSLRKWLPITDGGIVAYKKHMDITFPSLSEGYDEASYSELLISLCRNRIEDIGVINYLEFEKKANRSRYIDYTPKKINSICKNIISNQNYHLLAKKRIDNYIILYNGLSLNNNIQIVTPALAINSHITPFGFLILAENRDKFYDYLVSKNIIPEIQWKLPLDKYTPGEDAKYISDHNIMLQCDQRYSETEMQYVVDIINGYNFQSDSHNKMT